MNQEEIIQKTAEFVREKLSCAEGGHDWWHIYRVWKSAKHIALNENADSFVVECGALLHDIADAKFHGGDETIGPRIAREFLASLDVDEKTIAHVENIVKNISFKNSFDGQQFTSLELNVVQDADRLDAIGAIGIARAFNYGGFKGREIYNPDIAPIHRMTKEEYKKNNGPTVNHFHEKLLLLKDQMNTKTGKEIAKDRHAFMEQFLDQFHKEWRGE